MPTTAVASVRHINGNPPSAPSASDLIKAALVQSIVATEDRAWVAGFETADTAIRTLRSQKASIRSNFVGTQTVICRNIGDPGWIRTSDPQLRRLVPSGIAQAMPSARAGRCRPAVSWESACGLMHILLCIGLFLNFKYKTT
jgi:hypothetical protein